MVNRTPLRLVAIEESLPEADTDESGTPVAIMTENDAITRRVLASAEIAMRDTFRDKPKRTRNWKILVSAAAIAAIGILVVALLVMKGKGPAASPSTSAPVIPVASPAAPPQSQPSVTPPAPVAAAPLPIKAVPEIIRLEVTAEPMEAELSLDGNVLAGHRLNLKVPKDRGIHVVSASAPGYVPFNQQVSFSSDVVLNINLRRGQTPPVRQAARPRPSQPESRSKGDVSPIAGPQRARLEPGMNLDGPSLRPSGKQIDERNPYKP